MSPATTASLREPPAADATRIGEALGDVRARYAGRDLGAVVVISDGIDTGRIGEGPLDADDAHRRWRRWARPIHTVGLGEKSLRDLSVAAVLADQFAFVRTPASIEAVIRQTGLPDRQVEVTLERDGRPVATRSVVLRGDRSEEKIAFDWLPDHPGNFVFRISTPVLGGEALQEQQRAGVHAQGDPRSRARAAPVGRPSWDERFLRAMLRRDPNVDLVSFFILRTESDEQPWNRNDLSLIPFPTYEIFEEQLRSFDLVIFQNFNYAPYGVEPFLPDVRDYVEGGGALAMVGGDLSFAERRLRRDRAARRAAGRAAAHTAGVGGRGRRGGSDHRHVPAAADGRGAHASGDVADARPARERAALGESCRRSRASTACRAPAPARRRCSPTRR